MFESLAQDIRTARRPKMCTVGRWIEALNDKDRERFEAVLADQDLSATEIAQAIRDDFKVAPQTLARHRRRGEGNGCTCP